MKDEVFRGLRRAWQVFFLLLFLFLLLATTSRLIRGYPVEWFLAIDPLAAVSTALSTHALHGHLWWAAPLVVLTLVFGRFFCGWMCPMGTMHHVLGFLLRSKRVRERLERNRTRRSRAVKYAVLAAMLGAAFAGSVQAGLLDPIATTWRALSVSVFPALSNATGGYYQGERRFTWSLVAAGVFYAAIALNLVYPRFYCRVLCPLGALLGVLSKLSLFRIVRRAEACKDCDVCAADCAGAADPAGTPLATECMLCLNCTSACPRGAIAYRFLPSGEGTSQTTDLSRRRWIAAAAAGVALVPLTRASAEAEPRPDPRRIRPPGARDEPAFLALCLKCGACMKACPTGGLQPAATEAGLEGLWTPVLVPRIGYCEQACVLCGRVCPTGAIRELAPAEKVGRPPDVEPVRIGLAAIDRGRCLPWASDTECVVCEEVCPTAPKAVYFKLETTTLRDGSTRVLRRPFVDPKLCTGCGVCETRCPVFDRAAVRVTSTGESRSTVNRVILGGRI